MTAADSTHCAVEAVEVTVRRWGFSSSRLFRRDASPPQTRGPGYWLSATLKLESLNGWMLQGSTRPVEAVSALAPLL